MSMSGKKLTEVVCRILLFFCFILAAGTLSAQKTDRVTLPKQTMKLSELFKEVERQTKSVVVVNVTDIDTGEEVYVARKEGAVAEILDQALAGTGLTYRLNGRYVIITSMHESATEPELQTTVVPQPTQAEFDQNVRDYTRQNLSAQSQQTEVTMRYDTIRTERPHDGVFEYPSRSLTPVSTNRVATTSMLHGRPPFLAIKTNLVWAATLTPNLAAEIGLGRKTSIEISGGNNRWNLDGDKNNNKKLVHWVIKPEFRYWLCERFNGHFFGVHAFYGKYNVSGYNIPLLFDKEYRYEGDAWGGGISYGYHWAFAKRWGAEFTAGVGAARMEYVKKDCEKCGNEIGRFNKTYFGPTSLGVKIVFVIK